MVTYRRWAGFQGMAYTRRTWTWRTELLSTRSSRSTWPVSV